MIGLTRDGRLDAGRIWSRLLSITALMLIAWSQPELAEAEFAPTQLTTTAEGNGDPAISADGTRVAFHSAGNLTGGNADGDFEIFRWTSPSTIIQLTDTAPILGGGMEDSAISADGTRIAFASNHNLTGDNPDGNEEIFLWTSPSTITQLTKSIGADIDEPAISADGTRIAFASNHNLTGDNSDGNWEIFLWTSPSTITQLTDSTVGNNYEPAISADGTRIAFVSWSDLTGENSDGNEEIVLWTSPSTITQLTDTTAGANSIPTISADGTRIAFVSSDPIGSNPDGNEEIVLWTSPSTTTQLTITIGSTNFSPTISADGTRIAFHSDGDLAPAPNGPGNTDGNSEIFLWTAGSGITQLTASIVTTGANNFHPTISADGTRIAFISSADLVPGGNTDGSHEIFLLQEYHTLTITIAGTGAGTVTGPGITCPGDCTKAFPAGSPVVLSTTVAPGSVFTGFSGDPDCTDGSLTMNADTDCIATFSPAVGPDLTGTWNPVSQSWSKGRYTLRGTVRVVNQGTTTASASRLRIFLSDDAVLDPSDEVLKKFKIKKRKPGQGKTKEIKVKLPVGVSAAGKYLFAVVDARNDVVETNEANNTPMTGPIL